MHIAIMVKIYLIIFKFLSSRISSMLILVQLRSIRQASSTGSKKSHFQNESKCETFVVKMSFICIIIKNHFHINGFALSLALKVRFFGTWKWPILSILAMLLTQTTTGLPVAGEGVITTPNLACELQQTSSKSFPSRSDIKNFQLALCARQGKF